MSAVNRTGERAWMGIAPRGRSDADRTGIGCELPPNPEVLLHRGSRRYGTAASLRSARSPLEVPQAISSDPRESAFGASSGTSRPMRSS